MEPADAGIIDAIASRVGKHASGYCHIEMISI